MSRNGPKLKRRRGVSVLEVLFGIGVMAVGLLGVIAVLPVALSQSGKGVTKDRAARLGMNAIELVQSANMANPNQWLWYDTSVNQRKVVGTPSLTNNAYLIDPLLFSAHYAGSNATAPPAAGAVFPLGTAIGGVTNYPFLWRVGLRRDSTAASLTGAAADHLFVARDDLALTAPEEKTLPPYQEYGDGYIRQIEGGYSWMASVVPKFVNSGSSTEFKNIYILSVVVFHKRDPKYSLTSANERLVKVNFSGGGYGGGEAAFQSATADEVLVQSGDWVMLMAKATLANSSSDLFRWYRVAETGEVPDSNGTDWELAITLDGPDWPVAELKVVGPSGTTTIPTYAAIVPHVVGVYERELRLEESSLWYTP